MIRGLMHQVGSQEESYLASFATLSLVAKLIAVDAEYTQKVDEAIEWEESLAIFSMEMVASRRMDNWS